MRVTVAWKQTCSAAFQLLQPHFSYPLFSGILRDGWPACEGEGHDLWPWQVFSASWWNVLQCGWNPKNGKGMSLKYNLFLVWTGLPSVLPNPPHTHIYLCLPHSAVIREWKRNLVFTVTSRLLLQHEQTQGYREEVARLTSSLTSTAEPREQGQIDVVLLMR